MSPSGACSLSTVNAEGALALSNLLSIYMTSHVRFRIRTFVPASITSRYLTRFGVGNPGWAVGTLWQSGGNGQWLDATGRQWGPGSLIIYGHLIRCFHHVGKLLMS